MVVSADDVDVETAASFLLLDMIVSLVVVEEAPTSSKPALSTLTVVAVPVGLASVDVCHCCLASSSPALEDTELADAVKP